jgi:uncharacterized protein involved in exopolysaccharide biosynthesis
VVEQEMIFPLRRRRLIDLRPLRRARAREQTCCAAALETIDQLTQQIAGDRAAMAEELARLRKQFSLDLAAVCAELRAARQELHRMKLVNEFSNSEHRDLSQPLH